jgi:hypothetical protein
MSHRFLAVAAVLAAAAPSFGKNCGPGDIDDVIRRGRAMAAKERPNEAEKLFEGAWAACGAEIGAKGDHAQETRRRDFLLDWLDLAARMKRTTSCLKVQRLLGEHVGDLAEHSARVGAAKRRCETDRM